MIDRTTTELLRLCGLAHRPSKLPGKREVFEPGTETVLGRLDCVEANALAEERLRGKIIVHHITMDAPKVALEHYHAACCGRMPEEQSRAIAQLWRARCYAVAAVIDSGDFNVAWKLTQNVDTSWSMEPDPRVRVVMPLHTAKDGRTLGLRSSMIGDLFELNGRMMRVESLGFAEQTDLPVAEKEPA